MKKKSIIIAISILVVLIIVAIPFFNWFQYVIGNDTLVQLHVDTPYVTVKRGDLATVNVSVATIKSLFCTVQCEETFTDLQTKKTWKNNTELITGYKRSIALDLPNFGAGRKQYQYEISCHTQTSLFCHASNETKRTSLVVVDYEISDAEQQELESMRPTYELYRAAFSELEKQLIIANQYGVAGVTVNTISYDITYAFAQRIFSKVDTNIKNGNIEDAKEELTTPQLISLTAQSTQLEAEVTNITNAYEKTKKYLENSTVFISTHTVLPIQIAHELNQRITEINTSNIFLAEQKAAQLETYAKHLSFTEFFINSYAFELAYCDAYNCTPQLFSSPAEACARIYTQNSSVSNQSIANDAAAFYTYLAKIAYNETAVNVTEARDAQALAVLQKPLCANAALPQVLPTITIPNTTNYTMPDVKRKCVNECQPSKELPIIFIHGHAFNEKTSFEYTLGGFDNIQQALSDTYIAGGAVSQYTQATKPGIWQELPIMVKASYYADVFNNGEDYVISQSKTESLDAYVVRVQEIMKSIQEKTNHTKFIFVAHSMGGLVVRRYAQLFGEENIDRIVYLGTPHEGVEGTVSAQCTLFGSFLECRDMTKNSAFLRKLSVPSVPQLNIIGNGCTMNNETGDGIVTLQNAQLSVETIVINGTCSGVSFLHNSILRDTGAIAAVKEFIEE